MDLYCQKCSEKLKYEVSPTVPGRIEVEPCETCGLESFAEGKDKGYDEGYDQGEEEGYDTGYDKGYEDAQPMEDEDE